MRARFARGDVAQVVKTSVPEASVVPELRRALKEPTGDCRRATGDWRLTTAGDGGWTTGDG